jgi:hypothetical protein
MHSYPDHQPLVVYYAILSSRLRLCDGRWKLVSYGAAQQGRCLRPPCNTLLDTSAG